MDTSPSSPPANVQRIGIVTGGTRGIGRGISECLAAWLHILILTYNTDLERATQVALDLKARHKHLVHVELVGGDLSQVETRDKVFAKLDEILKDYTDSHLQVMCHNAGQYVGITSDNSANLEMASLEYGNGSLINPNDGSVNLDMARYYHALYGEAWVDLCERSLVRMKLRKDVLTGNGSLIGISSPGCNMMQNVNKGYSMPGTGKSLMEYSMRIYAANAAAFGVNCNVIIPGAVKTEAWERLSSKRGGMDFLGMVSSKAALGKAPMDPTDIGDVVSFLAQPTGGGRFITGVSLPVDAALSMR